MDRTDRHLLSGIVAALVVLALTTTMLVVAVAIAAPAHSIPTCRPEPPDYPGCTVKQVRPYQQVKLRAEFSGHASTYRFHRMGQHPHGVVWDHIGPQLARHVRALYHREVRDLAAKGVTGLPTWAQFAGNTSGMCTSNDITRRFPNDYCGAITALQRAAKDTRRLLWKATEFAFGCNETVGSFIWAGGATKLVEVRTFRGFLRGGYYGAMTGEIVCQGQTLWGWARDLWPWEPRP